MNERTNERNDYDEFTKMQTSIAKSFAFFKRATIFKEKKTNKQSPVPGVIAAAYARRVHV